MFSHNMIPVDIHLPPEIRKALDVAAQMARWQNARITIVSVTGTQPGDVTHSDAEISTELQAIVDQLTAEFAEDGGGTITFNEDYSYAMHKGDLGEEGSWELEGDKLQLTIIDETPGDPLILRSLSSSAALVAWEEEHEVNLNELPEFTATIIFELNLSK